MVNTVYTTIAERRTHVAMGKDYVGNVNTYNNAFTRFFARLFGKSMTVDFNGKKRTVNKKSYFKLIRNVVGSDFKISQLRDYKLFGKVLEKGTLPTTKTTMRKAIGKKATKLAHQLAKVIAEGNTQQALKLIGKGADFDLTYYDRKQYGITFGHEVKDLKRDKGYRFKVFEGRAIIHAARKGNRVITQCLKDFGANIPTHGCGYTLTRIPKSIDFPPVPWRDNSKSWLNGYSMQSKRSNIYFYNLDPSLKLSSTYSGTEQ